VKCVELGVVWFVSMCEQCAKKLITLINLFMNIHE